MRSLFIFMLFLFAPQGDSLSDNVPQPVVMQLRGVDVSHHQKKIEWDSVATKEPVDFAFVKATEGHDFVDSLFCRNWDDLRRLGIRRGAYHFFRAYGCGDEQASHFLSQVEMMPGDLAPVLDIEVLDGIEPEIMVQEAHIWLQIVEKELGVKPIIYSNLHFYESYLAGHFDGYPLWIARYSDKPPNLSNGRSWDFWQYTDSACLNGVGESEVCLDYFGGTQSQLGQLCIPYPNAAAIP